MKRRMRHHRGPRPHPAELDPTSPHAPLPPGTVMLVCRRTGDPLGDVLEAEAAEGWWPDGRRYAIGLIDTACSGGHVHELPSQDEIAISVAEAKQFRTVIEYRVNVKR
jgi:hypothetical protein